jgi:hypothetical protein
MTNDRKSRQETAKALVGLGVLMYSAAAYDYWFGLSRNSRGAFATFVSGLKFVFGPDALFYWFLAVGTLCLWLAK